MSKIKPVKNCREIQSFALTFLNLPQYVSRLVRDISNYRLVLHVFDVQETCLHIYTNACLLVAELSYSCMTSNHYQTIITLPFLCLFCLKDTWCSLLCCLMLAVLKEKYKHFRNIQTFLGKDSYSWALLYRDTFTQVRFIKVSEYANVSRWAVCRCAVCVRCVWVCMHAGEKVWAGIPNTLLL